MMKTKTPARPDARYVVFNAAEVKRVVEHSINSPKQSPEAYTELTPEEPAVLFVHDQGVYLMSNGEPRDLLPDSITSYTAFARGCDPRRDPDWYDNARTLVGGDDFGETLPWAREIKALIDAGQAEIALEVSPASIELIKPGLKRRTH